MSQFDSVNVGFKAWLERKMEEYGLTSDYAVERLTGVPRVTIRNYVNGKTKSPSREVLGRLAEKPPLPKPPPVDVADLSPTQIVEAWLGKIQASDQVKASNAWCLDTPEVTFTGLEEWSIQNEVINEDRALVAVRVKSKSKLGVTQTKSGTVTLQRTGYRKGERSWCIVGFREL